MEGKGDDYDKDKRVARCPESNPFPYIFLGHLGTKNHMARIISWHEISPGMEKNLAWKKTWHGFSVVLCIQCAIPESCTLYTMCNPRKLYFVYNSGPDSIFS